MILVIPAIDLLGGQCVRLLQGSYEHETVYYDDPVKMAKLWRIQNARVLHVVDLDAARGGSEDRADNRNEIGRICQALDMERRGIRRIVYTDISRDGTMQGPNIEAYQTLGQHLTKAHITASGGVGGFEDLMKVDALKPYRVDSIIIGRALYENTFPCQKLWCWHNKEQLNLNQYSTARLTDDC